MIQRLHPYWPSIGLGITQIMGYGALYYAYAILLPEMAVDLGMSLSTAFGILSLALFFGGAMAPVAGHLVDRFGGRYVMTLGSLVAGLALLGFAWVNGRGSLFAVVLVTEAAGMCVLYNVAFASIVRLRSPLRPSVMISIITLFGGVASTIFWPATLALYNALDWRDTWIVLGAAYLVVCVPIHFLALSGKEVTAQDRSRDPQTDWPQLQGRDRRRGLLWMVISFTFSGFLMGAVMTLWVTNVQDLGHSAALAALAGAVIGPFKTVGRMFEMMFSRNLHPLMTYLLALGLTMAGFCAILGLGFTVPGIMIGAALYGMGDGIKTIARGTLPLALFGGKGYGARLGWIASLTMAVNAAAPFTFALLTESFGGWMSFAAMTVILTVSILAYFLIPDPRSPRHATA